MVGEAVLGGVTAVDAADGLAKGESAPVGAGVTTPVEGALGKAEEKRAAIIARQAAREQEEHPHDVPLAKKKVTNWAATPPIRLRRGRPGGNSSR